MRFDDGIIEIYKTVNIAVNGQMPVYEETLDGHFYFGYDTLGYNRYYTALQNNQQINAVVNIPEWHEIDINSKCKLNGGKFHIIRTVQHLYDDFNLPITKLSLERLGVDE